MPLKTSKVNKTIGVNIRNIRKNLEVRMTQDDLSKRIKLNRVSVVNIEGGRQGVTPTTLIYLSRALNVPITEFFKGLPC